MDELACFVPGMLALGSSGYGPGEDDKCMALAEEVILLKYLFNLSSLNLSTKLRAVQTVQVLIIILQTERKKLPPHEWGKGKKPLEQGIPRERCCNL